MFQSVGSVAINFINNINDVYEGGDLGDLSKVSIQLTTKFYYINLNSVE